MNTIFSKIISIAVLAALTFSFTLSVEAAEPEQLGGQIGQPANQIKVQPMDQQQGGQNQQKEQGQLSQPAGSPTMGQNQPKGQNQFNQPGGQQPMGQNQQSGQSFGKQPTCQNPTGGQGQSVGQSPSGQNQQKSQGQSVSLPTMGQNQPKGQSQLGQPSGQQPSQSQSLGQQGQGQFGGQNQLGQQPGQLKSQPMGQQQQPTEQNQFDGQEQFGQPASQQPSDQNQNFGQQPLAGTGQTESGQLTEQEQAGQEPINFKGGLFGNIGNKVFQKFKAIFNPNEQQPLVGEQALQGQPMGQQQAEQGPPLGQGQFSGQQSTGELGPPTGQMDKKQQAFIKQYEKKKEAYQEQIQTQEAARQHFLELRNEFANSKEPEKQEETKMLMTKQVQNYLENTAETMIKRVENLEERVSGMPKLPAVGKEKITADLNQDTAWLNDKLAEAKSTNDAAALKEIAEDIRGYWKDHDLKVKQVVGYTMLGKIDAVAEKAENMADVVESKLEEFKTKGLDVANAEEYLEEYHDIIDAAKHKRAEAESKFSSKDSAQAFQEGVKIVQDTKSLFVDVRDKMKDVLGEIKTLSKNSKTIKAVPKVEKEENE